MGNCNASYVSNSMNSLNNGITGFNDCLTCMTVCCGGRRFRNPGYTANRMERRIVRCAECTDAVISAPETLANFLRFERLRRRLRGLGIALANAIANEPRAHFEINENDLANIEGEPRKLYDNDEIIFENIKEGEHLENQNQVGSINETNVPKSHDDITMQCEYCKQDIPLDSHRYHQGHCQFNPKNEKQFATEEMKGRQGQAELHAKMD